MTKNMTTTSLSEVRLLSSSSPSGKLAADVILRRPPRPERPTGVHQFVMIGVSKVHLPLAHHHPKKIIPVSFRLSDTNYATYLMYSGKLAPGCLSASFLSARSFIEICAGATPLMRATISRTSSNASVLPATRTSSGTDAAVAGSGSVASIARRATVRPTSRSEVNEIRCEGEPYAVNSLFAMSKPTASSNEVSALT